MRTAAFTVWLLLALAVAAPANDGASPRPKLAAADWSTGGPESLLKRPPSKKLVEQFAATVEKVAKGDTLLGVEGGTYICSFRFADLRHNGTLSLVAGIGVVDRPSCRDLDVIDKTMAGFELYQSGGAIGSASDVARSIRDLRNDGHLEFLLLVGLGVLQNRCAAGWTGVFAWTGDDYTNVSDRFKDYYRQRLDSLAMIIPTLKAAPDSHGYSLLDKECLQAEAAAIQRFLRISPNAGIDQAIRLATSKDGGDRVFAAQILGAIGTPEARKYLEKLSADSDNSVMISAKYALSGSAKGPMKLAPDSFEHAGSVKF